MFWTLGLRKASIRSDFKIEELNADEIHEIEHWMKADRKWRFLQENENLVEVIHGDSETLGRLGITHEEIANRLASLINQFHYNCVKARLYSGEEIQQVERKGALIEDRYFISVVEELEYCHRQPCYFEILRNLYSLQEHIGTAREVGISEEDCKMLAKSQYLKKAERSSASATYKIVDLRKKNWHGSNPLVEFAAVMIHSIRDHHFFGGPKARMRIDPEKLVGFLGLETDKEYSPSRQELSIWFRVAHTPSLTDDYYHSGLTRKYGERIGLQDGLTAYIWVKDGVILSEKHVKLEKPLVIHDDLVDLQGNEIQLGQTVIRHQMMFFDIG